MKLKELLEEFKDYISPDWNLKLHLPVFVNPTPKEMADAGENSGAVKFIAYSKDKKVYVFDSRTHHIIVRIRLKLPGYLIHNSTTKGDAERIGNTRKYKITDRIDRKWKWLEKYGLML